MRGTDRRQVFASSKVAFAGPFSQLQQPIKVAASFGQHLNCFAVDLFFAKRWAACQFCTVNRAGQGSAHTIERSSHFIATQFDVASLAAAAGITTHVVLQQVLYRDVAAGKRIHVFVDATCNVVGIRGLYSQLRFTIGKLTRHTLCHFALVGTLKDVVPLLVAAALQPVASSLCNLRQLFKRLCPGSSAVLTPISPPAAKGNGLCLLTANLSAKQCILVLRRNTGSQLAHFVFSSAKHLKLLPRHEPVLQPVKSFVIRRVELADKRQRVGLVEHRHINDVLRRVSPLDKHA